MASNRSMKDKEMAAMLKKTGHVRRSSACPNHCGGTYATTYSNHGGGLMGHLAVCQGKKRKYSR